MYSFFLFIAVLGVEPDYEREIWGLSHEKYVFRQDYHKKLLEHGDQCLSLLRKYAKDDDLEIAYRCRQILLYHYNHVKPGNIELYPWVDCLPKDYPDREKVLDKYLPHDFNEPVYTQETVDYPHLRLATYKFMIDQLDSGKTLEEMRHLIIQMNKNELKWLEKGPRHYNIPRDE